MLLCLCLCVALTCVCPQQLESGEVEVHNGKFYGGVGALDSADVEDNSLLDNHLDGLEGFDAVEERE